MHTSMHTQDDSMFAVSFIKETIQEFRDDDIMGLAAEIACLLIFFTALSSIADEYTGVDVCACLQKQVNSDAIPEAVKRNGDAGAQYGG